MNRSHLGAAALALALVASACGSDSEEATATTEAESAVEDTAMDDTAMDGMDMDGMNMGDASATRADEVVGAALATGELMLLDTRPQGFDDVAGTAWIARHSAGTTVTVEVEGLLPDADYISHLHADVCANSGGDHYQFEIGGSDMPPNEIHLAFTSDADGNGFMTAENHQIAGLDAVAFVVHPVNLIDNKVACLDFVELEAGAAATAIEQGVDHDGMDESEMEDDSMEVDDSEMDEMDMEDDSMGEDS